MTMHSTHEAPSITYTVRYRYGTSSGTRKITLAAHDQRDPIQVMWARMARAGELTIPNAHREARIVDGQSDDE